ncbi:MAG: type II secretion system F family protein, partial [Rhodocyclaceae bacterium]|nr:type II secretion system F family protein [Rhodocyclaceae bacterium]
MSAAWLEDLAIARLRWDVARRADFYDIMADAAAQGLAQLEVLQQIRRHLKHGDGLALIIDRVLLRLRGAQASPTRGGQKTIGTELTGLLPQAEASMIAAGELSGAIEQGWRNAAQFARRQQALRASVLGALAKPTFYALAFLGLLLFLSMYLLPRFEQSKPRAQWPSYAQTLGWVSDHALWIVGGAAALLVAAAVLLGWLGRNWTGSGRDAADRRWPPFTVMSQIGGAGFMLGLASFLASGISFGEALIRMRATATPYMSWQIQRIEAALRQGKRPEEALLLSSLLARPYHWIVAVYGLVGAQDAARAYERIALEMARRTQIALQRTLGS